MRTEMVIPLETVSITGTSLGMHFSKAEGHNVENKLVTFSTHLAENSWKGSTHATFFLSLCLRFISYQRGSREPELDSSNSMRCFANCCRTDFWKCRIHCNQLTSNHFILKTSQDTEDNNSLCLWGLLYRHQAGKHAQVHFALHVAWNKRLYETASMTILEICIRSNALQGQKYKRSSAQWCI